MYSDSWLGSFCPSSLATPPLLLHEPCLHLLLCSPVSSLFDEALLLEEHHQHHRGLFGGPGGGGMSDDDELTDGTFFKIYISGLISA